MKITFGWLALLLLALFVLLSMPPTAEAALWSKPIARFYPARTTTPTASAETVGGSEQGQIEEKLREEPADGNGNGKRETYLDELRKQIQVRISESLPTSSSTGEMLQNVFQRIRTGALLNEFRNKRNDFRLEMSEIISQFKAVSSIPEAYELSVEVMKKHKVVLGSMFIGVLLVIRLNKPKEALIHDILTKSRSKYEKF